MKTTLCSHLDPVDVAGSLLGDPDGSLIKVQHCALCGSQRSGIRLRSVPPRSNGSAWALWAFGDWSF